MKRNGSSGRGRAPGSEQGAFSYSTRDHPQVARIVKALKRSPEGLSYHIREALLLYSENYQRITLGDLDAKLNHIMNQVAHLQTNGLAVQALSGNGELPLNDDVYGEIDDELRDNLNEL